MAVKTPVWEKPGPAARLYEHFNAGTPIVDQWLAILRKAWGDPHHPGLTCYPSVSVERATIPALIDVPVEVDVLTPEVMDADALVYIHGGGWISPMAGKHLAWAKSVAYHSRMQVIAIHYRLAPEHPFPAALHDCVTAYEHVRSTMGHERVFIGGDSAGANLAAAVIHYCHDQEMLAPDKLLFLCGVSDCQFEQYPSIYELGVGNPRGDAALLSFERFCYVPHIEDWMHPYVSPLHGDLSRMPVTLAVIAMDDPLRDDNIAFVEKMRQCGGDVVLLSYPDMPHTFYTYPEYLPKESKEVNAAIINFLRQ